MKRSSRNRDGIVTVLPLSGSRDFRFHLVTPRGSSYQKRLANGYDRYGMLGPPTFQGFCEHFSDFALLVLLDMNIVRGAVIRPSKERLDLGY